MSALQELEAVRARVRDAELRVDRAEREARAAEGADDRAQRALTSYLEQVGAGEREPDTSEEARLRQELRRARDEVEERVIGSAGAAGAAIRVHGPSQALLAGAKRALENEQRALDAFLQRFSHLVADELAAKARDLAARYEPIRRQVDALEREWATLSGEWRPVLEALRLPSDALPESPARTGMRRPVEPPIPPGAIRADSKEGSRAA